MPYSLQESRDKFDFLRSEIAFSFSVYQTSRSFEYDAVRVQTSAPSRAPVPDGVYLEQTQIVRVLRLLRPHEQAWLRYAYAVRDFNLEMVQSDKEAAAVWLWESQASTLFQMTPDKRKRAMGLLVPALDNTAWLLSTGKRKYSARDLVDLTSETTAATMNCWKRDWAPFWRSLNEELQRFDYQTLFFFEKYLEKDNLRKTA